MFSREDLSGLLKNQSRPAVTIMMPATRTGQEQHQNLVRFDNLLDTALTELVRHGLRQDAARELLGPAAGLVQDDQFWRRADEGMAFFLAPGLFRWFAVPVPLPERARVGSVFHVAPLLPLVNSQCRFVLIAATAARFRVFDGGRHWIRERQGLDFPEGVAAINNEGEFTHEYQAAPQARPRSGRPAGGMPSHQGSNDAEEQRHANLIEYLRRANAVLEKALANERGPVVLAAQPNIQGNLRAMFRAKGLLKEGLGLNPDVFKPEDLHDKALPLVEPIWQAEENQASERLASIRGEPGEVAGKVATKPEEIVRAAREGRVECLYVALDRPLWGRYQERRNRLIGHGHQTPEDDEVADIAAAETLRHAGQVAAIRKDQLTAGEIMAALLRY